MAYIKSKVNNSLSSGSLISLWSAAFLAVYREGAETVLFYQALAGKVFIVDSRLKLSDDDKRKLTWLFGEANLSDSIRLSGTFIGPRKEMITPWSTNAVEITLNMGIKGIERIEEFRETKASDIQYDPMLQARYDNLDQNEELAVQVDVAIRDVKKDGWRSTRPKRTEVRIAIQSALGDNDDLVDTIYKIAESQRDY